MHPGVSKRVPGYSIYMQDLPKMVRTSFILFYVTNYHKIVLF